MNLDDFEARIDRKILDRGLAYFQEGRVESLTRVGNEWLAEVWGSEDYAVSVMVDDGGEILLTSCDCPYDWGPHCKHIAAVLYALREKPRLEKENGPSIDQIIGARSREELAGLLLEYAKRDKAVRTDLYMRYGPASDREKLAKQKLDRAVSRAEYDDYVSYEDDEAIAEAACRILHIANDVPEAKKQAVSVPHGDRDTAEPAPHL